MAHPNQSGTFGRRGYGCRCPREWIGSNLVPITESADLQSASRFMKKAPKHRITRQGGPSPGVSNEFHHQYAHQAMKPEKLTPKMFATPLRFRLAASWPIVAKTKGATASLDRRQPLRSYCLAFMPCSDEAVAMRIYLEPPVTPSRVLPDTMDLPTTDWIA